MFKLYFLIYKIGYYILINCRIYHGALAFGSLAFDAVYPCIFYGDTIYYDTFYGDAFYGDAVCYHVCPVVNAFFQPSP